MGCEVARRSPQLSEWERWQRAQTREAERQQRAAAAAAKAAEREQRQDYIGARKAEAEAGTAQVQARTQQLEAILATGLSRPSYVGPESLRQVPQEPAFDPGGLARPIPQPVWGDYAPTPPGALASVFGGRARYQREYVAARDAYDRAGHVWRQAEQQRQHQLAAARSQHEALLARNREEAEKHNQMINRMVAGLAVRGQQAVEDYLRTVLGRVPQPSDFPCRTDAAFSPQAEQAVVQVELPGRDVVPTVRGYKYIQSRDELQELVRPAKETGELYRLVIAQLALLITRDLFDADHRLASVAFNGHVDAVNPATGQREYPCLISLSVEREAFAELVLDQVRPDVCLRHLNALVSPHPYELEPVTPILDFDLTKYAFVDGMDAVSSLDSRPDLMDMSPTEFEHLVRQVFEAMGMEGWTTHHSYDDGVDAVVVNRTPLVGGLTIVQAKRYRSVVGVNHIRELAGAMEEKRAGRGVLVTTSWFASRTWKKASEHGRIELIDGPRLVYLIAEHLGKQVLIGVERPRTTHPGPPERSD
jgi:restriction system protein